MRLINNAPIKQLYSIGLPQSTFEQARSLLSSGEHLKVTEQKLNFLSRCKKNKVFPNFIYKAISVNMETFNLSGNSQYVKNLTNKLRLHALNKNISHHYEMINIYKQQIKHYKDVIYQTCNSDVFNQIMNIFNWYLCDSKKNYKEHLQRRYDWLLFKYYPVKRKNVQFNCEDLKEPEDRVTLVNCDNITEKEKGILALGPDFSVTPRIDDKFLEKLKVDLAHGIFKVRHQYNINASNGESTSEQTTTELNSTAEREVGAYTESTDAIPEISRNLFSDVKKKCPFQYSFTKTPDPCDAELEDKLAQFNRFVVNLTGSQKVSSNLTRQQREGLNSLIRKRDQLHYSESDKCGEFVVTKVTDHKQLTMEHLNTTPVYSCILPTKKTTKGYFKVVSPTQVQKDQLIKKKTEDLTLMTNKLWKEICSRNKLSDQHRHLLQASNTTLPCLYVQIKTHKNSAESFKHQVPLSSLKVRPIISCVDCPTEKLAWLVTDILSPLLNFIPSHLSGLYKHLEELRNIPKEQLIGHKFYTADVSALYTNTSAARCIDNVIEFAKEYEHSVDFLGITLTDVHMILEHILGNSFFTFDGNLYQQLDGLFMGLRPSPVLAVVRMHYLEKNSVYVDLVISPPPFYKRYIDDAAGTAKDEEAALLILKNIADQDEDGRINWELEFPTNPSDYIPFLNSELKILSDGTVSSRLYRKPTKKWITLHSKSHQPQLVKINTIRNSYREARLISSGPDELQHSLNIVDALYERNGFHKPRRYDLEQPGFNRKSKPKVKGELVNLTLDFISDSVSNKIKNEVKRLKLPFRINFVSNNKLKNKLCCSRPYDKRTCRFNRCRICPNILSKNKDCSLKNAVYRVDCVKCGGFYIGETERTLHQRMGEHLRYASHPTTPSNRHQSLAIHYMKHHIGVIPELKFSILTVEPNTAKRKIFEALSIIKLKPSLNLKEELLTVQRFLGHRARI